MAENRCPVCGWAAEFGRDADYGERRQIRCPRCGPYVITRTALAMLNSRVHGDIHVPARLSHAIRSAISDNEWTEITSMNLDTLISTPLPPVPVQLQNLLLWMKRKAGDNYLGSIDIRDGEALAAIVGAADQESARKLLAYAVQEGLMEFSNGNDAASLTPKAWNKDQLPRDDQNDMVTSPSESGQEPKVIRGHCPRCGAATKADIVSYYEHRWDHEEWPMWSIDTYRILRCRGCETVYFQHENLFSENESVELNPETGELEPTIEPRVTYWPAPATRTPPEWHHNIKDETLRYLLDEVYKALNSDIRALAAMGARAIIDRATELCGAKPADGFAAKLGALRAKGVISQQEEDILLIMTDAGSAASHRGWRPEPDVIGTILNAVEAFLYRAFILEEAAAQIKKRIPIKPKKKKN